MIEAIHTPVGISEEEASAPALQNFAVARCRDAWERAYQATAAKGKTLCSAHEDAAKAYRRAMPPLSGHQNICDFIACAGYGMLLGAIRESSATTAVSELM